MRTIKAISPTGLHLWESDREKFYLDRLCETRSERWEQSPAASVGSGFDAFVKCKLHADVFGNDGDGVYDLKKLFDAQVEGEDNRKFAWRAGEECLKRYVACGAYKELLDELLGSTKDPQFEFTLRGEIQGIPLTGKPDLYYYHDLHVLYDWKVMGFCSKYSQSPKKLHRSCRDTWDPSEYKQTRGGGGVRAHKNYEEIDHKGHKIGAHWLEEVDKKWADQLAIYAWMIGSPVGCEDTVVGIDQLACKPNKDGPYPLIRVAQHRCRVSEFHQRALFDRLKDMWTTIESGHIFQDLSREENDEKIETLDAMQAAVDEDPEREAIWAMCNEKEYRG